MASSWIKGSFKLGALQYKAANELLLPRNKSNERLLNQNKNILYPIEKLKESAI